MAASRTPALTADLVARVWRSMPDPGPPPGMGLFDDADFRALRDRLLAERPSGAELLLFAYGSLIWKPGCAIAEQRVATLHGWHRRFCFRINRYRGCDERPGLMMTLDRGGACKGVIQRLPGDGAADCLEQVLRREHSYKPSSHRPIWVKVRSEGRSLPAIAFVMDRAAPTYLPDLTPAQQAEMIAFACGHRGPCAEYLLNTVEHLEALGIHDRYLWQLQKLVAERIAGTGASEGSAA